MRLLGSCFPLVGTRTAWQGADVPIRSLSSWSWCVSRSIPSGGRRRLQCRADGLRLRGRWTSRACQRNCERLGDKIAVATCRAECRTERRAAEALCRDVGDPCAVACADGDPQCPDRRPHLPDDRAPRAPGVPRAVRRPARHAVPPRVRPRRVPPPRRRAGFVARRRATGRARFRTCRSASRRTSRSCSTSAELAVVAAADARAETLRSRPLRLWVGRPGATVTVTQTKHAFTFGFPIDFRELQDRPDDLAFYGSIAAAHTTEMVAETSLKWRVGEPSPGVMSFDLADASSRGAKASGSTSRGTRCSGGTRRRSRPGSGIRTGFSRNFRTRRSRPPSRRRSAGS
jgi:hypothetical protein